MRRSIHNVVAKYCGKDMTFGQFYEEAAILFMDWNQKEYTPLLVSKTERVVDDLDEQIQEIICIDDLETFFKPLKPGMRLHVNKKKKLFKLLKECKKVNNRGDRLEELMKEALSYLV